MHRSQHNHETAREVEVYRLVATPYGYQIFDDDTAAYISTITEYRAMQDRLAAYLDRVEAERLRDPRVREQANRLREFETDARRDAVSPDVAENFERLQSLRQSGEFRRHRHAVLNFIEAMEDLHERGMDGGFLRRVANENNEQQRRNLVQFAYEVGWGERDAISTRLMLNLLERTGLVEIIDLVSEDNDDSSEESEGSENETVNV